MIKDLQSSLFQNPGGEPMRDQGEGARAGAEATGQYFSFVKENIYSKSVPGQGLYICQK